MLTVTERAARRIHELAQEGALEGPALRVFVQSGGCSGFEYGMKFDAAGADDVLVEAHGARLIIDPASLQRMKGSRIDFDDGLHGKGFEIHNPNAASTCGCGRSFA
jgi:iron-sulfur cluster assembly protein/iron-sulfur cluster insertion protein